MSTNIIKKPFMCVALVVVLLLGMVVPAFANASYDELPKNIIFKGTLIETDAHNEREQREVEAIFTVDEKGVLNLKFKDYFGYDYYNNLIIQDNGSYKEYSSVNYIEFKKINESEYKVFGLTLSGDGIIRGTVKAVEETQSLSTMLSGNTTSKWGEYDVALSGRIKGDFKEGVNELTADQIKAQTISAVVYNNLTDEIVTRNVNQITGVKVTVKDGKIVNVEVDGKAKTAEGRADTFNAKIDL